LAGSIHQNYDLLLRHDLNIVGEYPLRVQHCLISLPSVKKEEITKVISHPQALGQCAAYLRQLGVKVESTYDTAGSVKMLKESGARDTAAIASRRAAEIYGMQILEEGVEESHYTGGGSEDVHCVHVEKPAWRPVQSLERFCLARYRSDQDRITSLTR
jgi:prephenate dehydratase